MQQIGEVIIDPEARVEDKPADDSWVPVTEHEASYTIVDRRFGRRKKHEGTLRVRITRMFHFH